MRKLLNVGAAILLSHQLGCVNPDITTKALNSDNEKTHTELVRKDNIIGETTLSVYELLENRRDSIVYSVKRNANIYRDADGKDVFCKCPDGIVLRESAVVQDLSDDNFLCISYGGQQVWVDRKSLVECKGKSLDEIYAPTSEKIIKVDKQNRKMVIYDQYGKHKVKEFKIGICSGDDGDKRLEGDGNTPEGKYYICFKNPASSFGTNPKTGGRLGSLQVSYPNSQDAFEGFISGDITQNQFNSINASIKSKGVPSQGTNLGNYIMIHGGGSDYDWTIGCMALDDGDMLWLYRFIDVGADLYIQ